MAKHANKPLRCDERTSLVQMMFMPLHNTRLVKIRNVTFLELKN